MHGLTSSASDMCATEILILVQEPLRSLTLGGQNTRGIVSISCHDFLPGAKDGVDTLVGMTDGQGWCLAGCWAGARIRFGLGLKTL